MKSLDENLYKAAQNRQSVPFAWHKIKTIQRIIAVPYLDHGVGSFDHFQESVILISMTGTSP